LKESFTNRDMPKPPKSAKKKIALEDDLLWSFITKENIQELDKLNDPAAEVAMVSELFGFGNWNSDLLQSIQLSFYHNLYTFGKENSFSPAQLSIFVSIMKITLDKWTEVGFKNQNIPDDFKALVLKNVIFQNDDNFDQFTSFSPAVAKLVVEYAAKTYMSIY
jgi:hypothetical protein